MPGCWNHLSLGRSLKVYVTLNIYCFSICVFTYVYSINHSLYHFYVLPPSEVPGWFCQSPFFFVLNWPHKAEKLMCVSMVWFYPLVGLSEVQDTVETHSMPVLDSLFSQHAPSPQPASVNYPLLITPCLLNTPPAQPQPASFLRLNKLWNTGTLCACTVSCNPVPHYQEEEMPGHMTELFNLIKG